MFTCLQTWLKHFAAAATMLAVVACGSVSTAYGAYQVLPVPKITIYPGDVISSGALGTKRFNPAAAQLPVFQTPNGLVGKVARRTLLPGRPIPLNAVRDASVVQVGKQVRLVFESGGLTITGIGIALQNGGVGDVLSLRNTDSGVTIRGTVQADGSVKVSP
jgi:flagella basal body P-ring formation protein FlgA